MNRDGCLIHEYIRVDSVIPGKPNPHWNVALTDQGEDEMCWKMK